MKLKLYGADDLYLPLDLDLYERIELAEKIIKDYSTSFEYSGAQSSDRKAQIRLDILATYILNAVKGIRGDVMSRYKIKRRPYQERPFSNFSDSNRRLYNNKLYSCSY